LFQTQWMIPLTVTWRIRLLKDAESTKTYFRNGRSTWFSSFRYRLSEAMGYSQNDINGMVGGMVIIPLTRLATWWYGIPVSVLSNLTIYKKLLENNGGRCYANRFAWNFGEPARVAIGQVVDFTWRENNSFVCFLNGGGEKDIASVCRLSDVVVGRRLSTYVWVTTKLSKQTGSGDECSYYVFTDVRFLFVHIK
jgi:hypothetical protein